MNKYRTRQSISSSSSCSSGHSLDGSSCPEHSFSSSGNSTSLEPSLAKKDDRYLSARYDDLAKVALARFATGLTCEAPSSPHVKAFPVPGYLAESLPSQSIRTDSST